MGFALLGLALGGLQLMLERGQQNDWFHSLEIWIEAGVVRAAGWMFVIHTVTAKTPCSTGRCSPTAISRSGCCS